MADRVAAESAFASGAIPRIHMNLPNGVELLKHEVDEIIGLHDLERGIDIEIPGRWGSIETRDS
jgi:hypothetical protein